MTAPLNTPAIVAEALFGIGAMVDAYGQIKAEIAALEAKAEAIKAALKETGREEFREGALFDCTMSLSERESVAIKALREKFGAEVEPLIKRSDVYTLRCAAKKAR